MFVACGIWLADVSSVSPSSKQTGDTFATSTLLPIYSVITLFIIILMKLWKLLH